MIKKLVLRKMRSKFSNQISMFIYIKLHIYHHQNSSLIEWIIFDCQSLWPLLPTNCGGLRPTREFCQVFGFTQKVKCLSQYWDYLMSLWRPPAMNSLFVTYQTLGSEATTNCCGLRPHKIDSLFLIRIFLKIHWGMRFYYFFFVSLKYVLN